MFEGENSFVIINNYIFDTTFDRVVDDGHNNVTLKSKKKLEIR